LYAVSRRPLSNDQDWASEIYEPFAGKVKYGRIQQRFGEREMVKYLFQARSRRDPPAY
jgi:hypothetical protein